MNEYEFTITISGTGFGLEDAWQDAIENLSLNAGDAPMSENKGGGQADSYRIIETDT